MSGASLEGCHTTSGRILNEERSVGPTVQAFLRLLIKTGQCCLLLDSNRMFSARCRWRLQREPVGQSTVASPKNNFHSIPNCRFQLCHRVCVCVIVSLLYTFFIPGAFLAHVVAPRRPHIQTGNNISSDNSITSMTPPCIIRFNFITLANPHHQPYWSSLIPQCLLPALMVIHWDGRVQQSAL